MVFVELHAGEGRLTERVGAKGVAVLQILDFRLGGPDLRTEAGLQHVLKSISAACSVARGSTV